jgi:type I restriction enzyme, S subunit
MNQRVGRFRFRGDPPVDEAFFYRTIRLPEIKERFEQLAGGSAQANLSGSQIEGVEIPLPDIIEQRRIGRLLRSLDTSVGLCRDRIVTLDNMSIAALRWAEAEAADMEAAP